MKSFIIFLIIVILGLSLASDRITIYIFSKAHDLDIAYKNLKNENFKQFTFSDISVIDNRRGLGLFARYAKARPALTGRFFREMALDFDMRDVKFIKKNPEASERYNDLQGLISTPFMGHWSYREISGRINLSKGGLEMEKVAAISDDIKLSLRGAITYNNSINCDLVIYFSDRLTAKIPEELSKIVLQDEKDGWKGLSVSLTGDYTKPSIHVSGKLFRLNIKTTPAKPTSTPGV